MKLKDQLAVKLLGNIGIAACGSPMRLFASEPEPFQPFLRLQIRIRSIDVQKSRQFAMKIYRGLPGDSRFQWLGVLGFAWYALVHW